MLTGAGGVVPVGGAGERFEVGPFGYLGIEWALTPRTGIRVGADLGWLKTAGPGLDLRRYGVRLEGVLHLRENRRLTPYLLAGTGAYRLQRTGGQPQDLSAEVHGGAGLNVRVSPAVAVFAEAVAAAHFTSYASDDYTLSTFLPMLLGLRLELD